MISKDWQSISGVDYFFLPSGALATGLYQEGNDWYYFDGNGQLVNGWKSIGGKWYFFNYDYFFVVFIV